ncbi:MAG: hypothetical protein Q7S11_05210, partial [bacterium]|nr:hypothetical protein [bacterium]
MLSFGKTLKIFHKEQHARIAHVCVISAGFIFGGIFLLFAFFGTAVEAAINKEIDYQGKLTNTSNIAVADGSYNIRFKLYTVATGGVATWTETWCYSPDSGTTCDGTGTNNRIALTSGLFSTMLGSTTALTSVDFNQTLYLGVEIGGSAATPTWDGEMTPRKRLGAVPAAFEAGKINGLESWQFLRGDASNSTSTAGTFVTINQTGAGAILNLTNGTANVFSALSTGLVSIGTSTPYSKLTVWGGGASTGQAFEIVNNASTTLAKFLDNGTGYFLGNIGIGTTSPYAKLSVAGQVVGEYYTATSTTATSTFAGGATFATSGGNVGVGTTTPRAKLDVVSTAEQLRLSYDSTNYVSLSSLSSGILSVGTKGVTNFKIGSDPIAGYSNLWPGGIASPDSTNYGWQTKNDGSEVWFNAASGGYLAFTVNNSGTLPIRVKGTNVDIGYLYNAATSNLLNVNGNASFVGNVGIGTTSPYAKLSVVGEIVGAYFTGTTTATSTFGGNLAINGTGTTTST